MKKQSIDNSVVKPIELERNSNFQHLQQGSIVQKYDFSNCRDDSRKRNFTQCYMKRKSNQEKKQNENEKR